MNGFNIGKILINLTTPLLWLRRPQTSDNNQRVGGFAPEMNAFGGVKEGVNIGKNNRQQIVQTPQNLDPTPQLAKMNNFAQTDRSVFVKNILGLPQNISVILQNAQNLNKPLAGGTLGMANLNQDLIQTKNALAAVFDEMNQTPVNPELANITAQVQGAKAAQDTVALMFSGMISMPEISRIILQNSKQAVAALVISMASASKQGLDGKQIQETLSIINSCIAMAESDNPAQNLKSLMMLYLPWLPLNEGVGFDLEITPDSGENESNDSKLTVLIQTKNYGNLKGVFTLTTSNSVDIYIICSDKFPKKELQKNLMSESSSHAMNTNIDIEEVKPINENLNETRETKVNLSATNEMNPYLLLMAHAFIRLTIMIDNNTFLEAA